MCDPSHMGILGYEKTDLSVNDVMVSQSSIKINFITNSEAIDNIKIQNNRNLAKRLE